MSGRIHIPRSSTATISGNAELSAICIVTVRAGVTTSTLSVVGTTVLAVTGDLVTANGLVDIDTASNMLVLIGKSTNRPPLSRHRKGCLMRHQHVPYALSIIICQFTHLARFYNRLSGELEHAGVAWIWHVCWIVWNPRTAVDSGRFRDGNTTFRVVFD